MVFLYLKLLHVLQDLQTSLIWNTKPQNNVRFIFTLLVLHTTCCDQPKWFLLSGHALSSFNLSITTFSDYSLPLANVDISSLGLFLPWAYLPQGKYKITCSSDILLDPSSLPRIDYSTLCVCVLTGNSLNTAKDMDLPLNIPLSFLITWHIIGNPYLWNDWTHERILNHF